MAKRYKNIDEILDFVLDADSENEIDLGESDSDESLSELDYDEGEDEPAVQFVSNENILHPVQVVEESESTTNNAIPETVLVLHLNQFLHLKLDLVWYCLS